MRSLILALVVPGVAVYYFQHKDQPTSTESPASVVIVDCSGQDLDECSRLSIGGSPNFHNDGPKYPAVEALIGKITYCNACMEKNPEFKRRIREV